MLLDTHAWLWAASYDRNRLGARAAKEIERAAGRGALVISVVSMFEVASLVASGRIHLATSSETWMRQSIELGRIVVAEVTVAVAIEAGNIPNVALADPMDRLLVATARQLEIPIVTRDSRILDYIRTSRVGRAIDAAR